MNNNEIYERRKLVVESLNEIQQELPVEKMNEQGIYFWPVIKRRLFFSAIGMNYSKEKQKAAAMNGSNRAVKAGLLVRIRRKIKLFWQYVYQCYLKPVEKVDYMTSGAWSHRIADNGVWKNRFFVELKGERIHFEYSTLQNEQIDLKENTYVTDDLFFLHKKYFSRVANINLEDNQLFKQVIDLFNLKTGLKVGYRQFNYHINEVYKWAEFWQKLLNRTLPGEIRVLCYYSIEMHGLCIAGFRKSIPVVDVQHGSIGDLDPAYNGFGKVPVGGYQVIPSHYSVWDTTSKNLLERTGIARKENILLEGNPWINYNRNRLTPKAVKEEKTCFLYTLQTMVDVPGFLIDTINSSAREYKWVLKPHPRMTHEELLVLLRDFKELVNEHLIEIDTRSGLLQLLQNADIHVSGFSASIQEAGLLGKPSVIVDRIGRDTFRTLIDEEPDLYQYVESKEQFFDAITKFKVKP